MAHIFTMAHRDHQAIREAQDPALAHDRMVTLASSHDPEGRKTLAAHGDLPIGVMLTLAQDQRTRVRVALAGNSSVASCATALTALAHDHDEAVLDALLDNDALPDAVMADVTMRAKGHAKEDAVRRLAAKEAERSRVAISRAQHPSALGPAPARGDSRLARMAPGARSRRHLTVVPNPIPGDTPMPAVPDYIQHRREEL